jgi:hypothetical protein
VAVAAVAAAAAPSRVRVVDLYEPGVDAYIIPKAQWDERPPFTFGAPKRWYGEVNSVGPDAAPLIIDAFSRLVTAGALRQERR